MCTSQLVIFHRIRRLFRGTRRISMVKSSKFWFWRSKNRLDEILPSFTRTEIKYVRDNKCGEVKVVDSDVLKMLRQAQHEVLRALHPESVEGFGLIFLCPQLYPTIFLPQRS